MRGLRGTPHRGGDQFVDHGAATGEIDDIGTDGPDRTVWFDVAPVEPGRFRHFPGLRLGVELIGQDVAEIRELDCPGGERHSRFPRPGIEVTVFAGVYLQYCTHDTSPDVVRWFGSPTFAQTGDFVQW
jgi:hypothetical protein